MWRKQISPSCLYHMLGTPFLHSCFTLPHVSSPLASLKISVNSGTSANESFVASWQPHLQMAPRSISVIFLGNWIVGKPSLHCCAHTWPHSPCTEKQHIGCVGSRFLEPRNRVHGVYKYKDGRSRMGLQVQKQKFYPKGQHFKNVDKKMCNKKFFLGKNASLLTNLKFLLATGHWWLLREP